jgi:hypothetical protein
MTKKLVTVVRARMVVEECVIERSELERINTQQPEELEDFGIWERLEELPFRECRTDATAALDFTSGFLAFGGDVTDHVDDLVPDIYFWHTEFPLEVDDETYWEKIHGSAQRRGL